MSVTGDLMVKDKISRRSFRKRAALRTGLLLSALALGGFGPALAQSSFPAQPGADWPIYGGSYNNQRYSSLKDVTPANAHALQAKGSGLTGFEIAGADRKFKPAQARIEGATVIVSSADVPAPVYVRYGWADNPTCNLSNGAGLPASPFRTDRFPVGTANNHF